VNRAAEPHLDEEEELPLVLAQEQSDAVERRSAQNKPLEKEDASAVEVEKEKERVELSFCEQLTAILRKPRVLKNTLVLSVLAASCFYSKTLLHFLIDKIPSVDTYTSGRTLFFAAAFGQLPFVAIRHLTVR